MYEQPFIPQLHRWNELIYIRGKLFSHNNKKYNKTTISDRDHAHTFISGTLYTNHSKANTSPTNVVEEGVISKFKSS